MVIFKSKQKKLEGDSAQGNFTKLFYKTNRYRKYSVTVSAVESWNKIQKQLKGMLLYACFCHFLSNFYFFTK